MPADRMDDLPGGEGDTLPLARTLEELYLFGEITDEKAGEIVRALARTQAQERRVRLWICSLGGDLGGALANHDALRRCPRSEADATGNCQSAALVAFLGAETRWATPNTIFHNHAIVGTKDESLALNCPLDALEQLQELPVGSFTPDEARQGGLIAWVELLLPDGEGLPEIGTHTGRGARAADHGS